MTIGAGELVFLIGASGSGKSTLLRLALGGVPVDAGEVRLSGRDVCRLPRQQLPIVRRQIGVVFQDGRLLPDRSLLENVSLVARVVGCNAAEANELAQARLEAVGLGHQLGTRPTMLSGGECQRAAIARATVHRPPVVLADEPTGQLDPFTSVEILELLRAEARCGAAVLVATHDVRLARTFGCHVVELRDGQLREGSARFQRSGQTVGREA